MFINIFGNQEREGDHVVLVWSRMTIKFIFGLNAQIDASLGGIGLGRDKVASVQISYRIDRSSDRRSCGVCGLT